MNIFPPNCLIKGIKSLQKEYCIDIWQTEKNEKLELLNKMLSPEEYQKPRPLPEDI